MNTIGHFERSVISNEVRNLRATEEIPRFVRNDIGALRNFSRV
jgi:hypothetical protein